MVVRSSDSVSDLEKKVEIATILGTLQSTFTNFRYLRSIWRKNTEEERLLGVSLTGVMDSGLLRADPSSRERMDKLRAKAVETNKLWAEALGIPQSTAITCVKPSGTVSQLVDSASGLHPRWSQYYIRRVRNDLKDPLTNFLVQQGVPMEVDKLNPSSAVFSFPQKAPEGSVLRNGMSAVQQLEHWKAVQEHWCEHKPSITCYYRDDEFLALGQWVWDNFDSLSGVAFLPHSDHIYEQAPYEEVDENKYNELLATIPKSVDWTALVEEEDVTEGSQTYACIGDRCEIV